MNPIKITLVDDDKIFVFLTKKTIEATKIETEVSVFGDGEEAIEYLRQVSGQPELLPDIICLDLSMPIMDGWEFLEEFILLKPALQKKVILYLVSSSISPHDIERAKSISVVSDFIIKPIAKEKIVELFKAFNQHKV
jgi:CheY-like chemotaxis protein